MIKLGVLALLAFCLVLAEAGRRHREERDAEWLALREELESCSKGYPTEEEPQGARKKREAGEVLVRAKRQGPDGPGGPGVPGEGDNPNIGGQMTGDCIGDYCPPPVVEEPVEQPPPESAGPDGPGGPGVPGSGDNPNDPGQTTGDCIGDYCPPPTGPSGDGGPDGPGGPGVPGSGDNPNIPGETTGDCIGDLCEEEPEGDVEPAFPDTEEGLESLVREQCLATCPDPVERVLARKKRSNKKIGSHGSKRNKSSHSESSEEEEEGDHDRRKGNHGKSDWGKKLGHYKEKKEKIPSAQDDWDRQCSRNNKKKDDENAVQETTEEEEDEESVPAEIIEEEDEERKEAEEESDMETNFISLIGNYMKKTMIQGRGRQRGKKNTLKTRSAWKKLKLRLFQKLRVPNVDFQCGARRYNGKSRLSKLNRKLLKEAKAKSESCGHVGPINCVGDLFEEFAERNIEAETDCLSPAQVFFRHRTCRTRKCHCKAKIFGKLQDYRKQKCLARFERVQKREFNELYELFTHSCGCGGTCQTAEAKNRISFYLNKTIPEMAIKHCGKPVKFHGCGGGRRHMKKQNKKKNQNKNKNRRARVRKNKKGGKKNNKKNNRKKNKKNNRKKNN